MSDVLYFILMRTIQCNGMAQNEFKSLVTILVIIHVLYTSYYLVTWDVSIVKGKAVPTQARNGPEGSRKLGSQIT